MAAERLARCRSGKDTSVLRASDWQILELAYMVLGLKPEGLVHPLPVVITTGLDATATKRPGGPIHESYWTVSAPVCRP